MNLVTWGLGGASRTLPASGMGGYVASSSVSSDWNIVGSELREKDQPTTVMSPYTHLHKKTL